MGRVGHTEMVGTGRPQLGESEEGGEGGVGSGGGGDGVRGADGRGGGVS